MHTDAQFQFARVETFRRSNIKDLVCEALRLPSHTSHISCPEQPRILDGNQKEFSSTLKDLVGRSVPVVRKDGSTYERRLRRDARIGLSCVISHPCRVRDLGNDVSSISSWVSDVLNFLNSERGGRAKLNTPISGRAAPMGEDRARVFRSTEDEQTTTPEPLSGIQGQGGHRGFGR